MPVAYLLGISMALHLYVGGRLIPHLPGALAAVLMAMLLTCSALFMPLGLFARRIARPPVTDTLAWIGLLFMGLFSSLLVGTVMRDALLLLVWLAGLAAPDLLPAKAIRETTAEAVPLLAFALTALGLLNARRTARVVTVDLPIAALPPALQAFRIVQISDIHVGPTIKQRYLEGIVEAVNRLKPDLVAITGDLVDGSVDELGRHVAPLTRLVSRHGSFFVTGNHEYYSGADPWIRELQRLGIEVLLNRHVVIEHGGARLVLAGVPDYSAHHYDATHQIDPVAALAGAPADAAVRVLLAHQPRGVDVAARAGFHVQLSGHTHGGQFLPWTYLVPLQQPFTAGLHRVANLWLYVSRGTGYWGPPKRLGAPSEITELRLVAATDFTVP